MATWLWGGSKSSVSRLTIEPGGLVECGTFALQRNATLTFYVAGPHLPQLRIRDAATFDGTLRVQMPIPPVLAPVADVFPIMSYGSLERKFSRIRGLSFGNGVLLQPEFGPRGLVLRAKQVEPLGQCGGLPAEWAPCDVYHWGGEGYDHKVPTSADCATICGYGCYLTSLCMALRFEGLSSIPLGPLPGALVPNDPGNLNAFMTNHLGYDGSLVNPVTTLAHLDHALGQRLRWRSDFYNSQSPEDLYIALDTGHPVIVNVPPSRHKQTNHFGHFVLVTGWFAMPDNSLNFHIADPALDGARVLLGPSGYSMFSIRGWVEDPPGEMSAVSISAPPSVDLLVTDSLGRRTGKDPVSGQILKEMPGSAYYNDTIVDDEGGDTRLEGDHVVAVSDPLPGVFTVSATNHQSGPCTVSVQSFAPDGSPNPRIALSAIGVESASPTFLIPVGTTLNGVREPDGGFRVRLATDTGRPFRIEAATNLSEWVLLGTVTPTNGFAELQDASASSVSSRFYRAVSVDPNAAALASLVLSSGSLTPAFASGVTAYLAHVPANVTSLTVTPMAADPGATIQSRVNGGVFGTVPSGSASAQLPLVEGDNAIEVRVTARDGVTTRSYAVTVNRAAAATPPGIVLQPAGRTNVTGSVATFEVQATGTLPLSYQWQFKGSNLLDGPRITGARSNALAISNVQFSDAGSYQVVITNVAGASTSTAALLAVVPPVIVDPAGNLTGDTNRAFMDIVAATLQASGTNFVLGVQMAAPFPTAAQMTGGKRFDVIWFVDIDRNLGTGQSASGNDYNIHVFLNETGWHAAWFKVSSVSQNDGIRIDFSALRIGASGGQATLTFPQAYLPSRSFDLWASCFSGNAPNWAPVTANPSTVRATFSF